MPITPHSITFDSTDPLPLAQWWAEQTGGEVVAENDGWFVVVDVPDGRQLAFQKVADPTPGKNRIHIDFTADDIDAAKAELIAAGAGHVHDRDLDGFRWTTLTDPDGNQFCVAVASATS
ncbi:VOC family protein [Nocardioides sp. SYSU DS0651]|uniref:VOC family protein n=1 Tax=Nocardioides sp. SYSU DS0651 TaxID=3415955 RepID=UPI003F4C6A43